MLVKELVRKVLGVALGLLLSCMLTFIIINAYGFIHGIEGFLTFLGIAAVGGFIAGFLSRNFIAGFLSGLLAGIIGVPIIQVYVAVLWNGFSFGSLLPESYRLFMGRYILFGLSGGTVGLAGVWIESKLIRKLVRTLRTAVRKKKSPSNANIKQDEANTGIKGET